MSIAHETEAVRKDTIGKDAPAHNDVAVGKEVPVHEAVTVGKDSGPRSDWGFCPRALACS